MKLLGELGQQRLGKQLLALQKAWCAKIPDNSPWGFQHQKGWFPFDTWNVLAKHPVCHLPKNSHHNEAKPIVHLSPPIKSLTRALHLWGINWIPADKRVENVVSRLLVLATEVIMENNVGMGLRFQETIYKISWLHIKETQKTQFTH